MNTQARRAVAAIVGIALVLGVPACAVFRDPPPPPIGVDQGDGNARRGPVTVLQEGRFGIEKWQWIHYEGDEGSCFEVRVGPNGFGGCGLGAEGKDRVAIVDEGDIVEGRRYLQGIAPAAVAEVVVRLDDGQTLRPSLVVPPKSELKWFLVFVPKGVAVDEIEAFDASGRRVRDPAL